MHLSIWFSKKAFYGFLPFLLNDKILKGFDKGMMASMILIDFQKVFNAIDHGTPLKKLNATGFLKHTVN